MHQLNHPDQPGQEKCTEGVYQKNQFIGHCYKRFVHRLRIFSALITKSFTLTIHQI